MPASAPLSPNAERASLVAAYLWLFMSSELAAVVEPGPFLERFEHNETIFWRAFVLTDCAARFAGADPMCDGSSCRRTDARTAEIVGERLDARARSADTVCAVSATVQFVRILIRAVDAVNGRA
jgi:hypothetical protein